MGLFSTTHVHRHESTHYIDRDITIKNAPTEESLKLLNEMQQKVKDNIIDSIKIEGNFINAVVVYFSNDVYRNCVDYEIKYTLNNIEYKISGDVSDVEFQQKLRGAYFGFGLESVAKVFIKEFTDKLMLNIFKQSPDFVSAIKDGKILKLR